MEARKRDLRTTGAQEEQEKGANGGTKGKKERVYAEVENEEGQQAHRIQMRQRIE